YVVFWADADHVQLASTANPGSVLILNPNSSDAKAQHSIARADEAPLKNLVDGRTYYVIVKDANHFQLSATKANPTPILISGVAGTVKHVFADEGIDLSPTSGTQRLRLDLTAANQSATQRLHGAGGLLSAVSAPPGDGLVRATAAGVSGGGVGAV